MPQALTAFLLCHPTCWSCPQDPGWLDTMSTFLIRKTEPLPQAREDFPWDFCLNRVPWPHVAPRDSGKCSLKPRIISQSTWMSLTSPEPRAPQATYESLAQWAPPEAEGHGPWATSAGSLGPVSPLPTRSGLAWAFQESCKQDPNGECPEASQRLHRTDGVSAGLGASRPPVPGQLCTISTPMPPPPLHGSTGEG